MADAKLSALTEVTALADADEFYVNDGGTSKRVTASNTRKFMGAGRLVDDYGAVGDGLTDDAAAIQAAIDVGEGLVVFGPKTYNVETTIEVPSGVTLLGEGPGVEIYPSDDHLNSVIRAGGALTRLVHFIETGGCNGSNAYGLTFNGDELCTSAVVEVSFGFNVRIENCNIVMAPASGCLVEINNTGGGSSAGHEVYITQCMLANDAKGQGIRNYAPDNEFHNNVIRGTTEYCFKADGNSTGSAGGFGFTGNHIYDWPATPGNMLMGVWIVGKSGYSRICDNYFDAIAGGPQIRIEPGATTGKVVYNNIISGNAFTPTFALPNNTHPGIHIDNDKESYGYPGVYGTVITGNQFDSDDYANSFTTILHNEGQYDSVVFTDNMCAYADSFYEGTRPSVMHGNSVSVDAYRHESDQLSENSGKEVETAGASQSTIAITHGLAGTPRNVQITPADTHARGAPDFYVTVSATTATLNFAENLDNGVEYEFFWRAEL